MTTAHRATWTTAKGREHQGGARLFGPSAKHSKLDANGFLTLKSRATNSSTDGADALLERDLRRELEEKEAAAREKARRGGNAIVGGGEGTRETLARLGEGDGDARFAPRAEDADDDASGSGSDDDGENDSDSESDSDDDDDTAALLAELERIKAERAEEARAKAAAEEAAARDKRQEELATGNPLLDLSSDRAFATKRRWDDDVVFRNQARDEPKVGKRFINDTIRSDFHKRFLNKYIK